jgi:predicted component of type VI protein secretion system
MARLILSLNGQMMAEYNMSKERYTIGRLPDNDVRIDNPTVSGHHSLIINILNDSFLEDLNSTNGTYVNGKLIKKHALQHGDVVTVGKHQLRYVDSDQGDVQDDEFVRTMVIDSSDIAAKAAAERVSAGTMAEGIPHAERRESKPLAIAKVQVLNGKFGGREVNLNKAVTTLGRPGAQVIAITRRSDGYNIVQVENSPDRDPPSVNGEVLGAQARQLHDNDVIQIIGIKMGFFVD